MTSAPTKSGISDLAKLPGPLSQGFARMALMLRDLGLASHVTDGTVNRQREIGSLGLSVTTEAETDLAKISDQVLAALANENDEPTNRN